MTSPRRIAGLAGLALLALFAATRVPAKPPTASWDPVRVLAGLGWVGSGSQHFYLPGAHVTLQQFAVKARPVEAARRLIAASEGRLTRMQVAAGVVYVSGLESDAHWLVEIRQQGSGTIGLISRLRPIASRMSGFNLRQIIPPGAQRLSLLNELSGQVVGALGQFRIPGTTNQVRAQLFRTLRLAGWVPESPSSVGGRLAPVPAAPEMPSAWRHAQHGRLTIFFQPVASAVFLTVWHQAKEPS